MPVGVGRWLNACGDGAAGGGLIVVTRRSYGGHAEVVRRSWGGLREKKPAKNVTD